MTYTKTTSKAINSKAINSKAVNLTTNTTSTTSNVLQGQRMNSSKKTVSVPEKIQLKNNLNILCVDDDDLMLELIEAQLASFEARITKCTSVQAAKEFLESTENTPDVILCDIMMPETIGYEFHDYLKTDDDLVKIPFIYVTALYSERHYRKGMLQGADGYLAKPFSQQELVQEIGHVLKRHADYTSGAQEMSAYIQLLGGQSVRVNGVLEGAPDRGAEQVIYYLILQGESGQRNVSIKRSDVMTTLWESISQSGFRSVLSRAKRWSDSWANWHIDRTTINFSLKEHVHCDLYLLEDVLDTFKLPNELPDKLPDELLDTKQIIDKDKLKNLNELYQGELLPSFPEAWAGSRRTYLAETVKSIYIAALNPSALPRRYARAIKRILDIDPDDFDLWEEYITTLSKAGMEQEAQRAKTQLEQQQN